MKIFRSLFSRWSQGYDDYNFEEPKPKPTIHLGYSGITAISADGGKLTFTSGGATFTGIMSSATYQVPTLDEEPIAVWRKPDDGPITLSFTTKNVNPEALKLLYGYDVS